MNKLVIRIARGRWVLGTTLALASILVGCATTPPLSEADLERRVEQAATPADHLALAGYFEERAVVAEHEREEWRELRKYYEHRATPLFFPTGTVAGMLSHYDQLIQAEDGNARQFRALAQLHRGLAEHLSDGSKQ